jgi:hypothetical protein
MVVALSHELVGPSMESPLEVERESLSEDSRSSAPPS